MSTTVHKTIDLAHPEIDVIKTRLKEFILQGIEFEDSLFALLKNDEAFYQRPEPLRHPLIFYYGHTFTFFTNKLYAAGILTERLNPRLEAMLAIGVDEMSWDDLHEANYDWPTVSELRNYREEVKTLVLNLIDKCEATSPVTWESPLWPFVMGAEHHRIHFETSSVLIRQLDLKYIKESSAWTPCSKVGLTPTNPMLEVKAIKVVMGKDHQAPLYGWDNEYGRDEVSLKPFKASQQLVSNGEFLKFVRSGGYECDQYWSEEGAKWRHFKKASYPHFWFLRGDDFYLRLIEREIELPLDWPVEVNYLEAHAYCNWKSEQDKSDYRLPTEAEWFALLKASKVAKVSDWEVAPGNLNFEHFKSPCPVTEFRQGDFYDVTGNVWQWTETAIYPFDGFKIHELYDDFSVPTFDGLHNLIKGGSFISTGNEANMDSRYAFRRHFFQHAGFRYVESPNSVKTFDNTYETDLQLSQYCEFHYGDEYFNTANFPKACIEKAAQYFNHLDKRAKALDLGCAVGRSTFELAKYFDEVLGIDYSARFIDKAIQVHEHQSLRYTLTMEGEIMDFYERDLKALGLSELKGKIDFMQGDACNLAKKYSNFDLIFAGNLIDRLRSPRAFLKSISDHMNPGALLIITSPYTWLTEFTPKEEWLGGYKRDGENVTTLMGLKEELSDRFELIDSQIEIPFVIRETKRKFQHSISEMSVWKLKK